MIPWLVAHGWSVLACIGTFVLGVMYAAWQQLIIEDVDAEMWAASADDCETIIG